MSDPKDLQDDEELRALYRSQPVEPDATLDARILDAARAAAPVKKRSWRYPVGVGAAASALIALALFLPVLLETLQTADQPVVTPAVTRAATSELRREADARDAKSEIARSFASEAPTAQSADEVALSRRVRHRVVCSPNAQSLSVGNTLVCVTDQHIEVWDRGDAGCVEPLALARAPGTVGASTVGLDLVVTLDGTPRWRIRCAAGAWQVEAAPVS